MSRIAVALSGGGHRAALFGLGVLLYLVDAGKHRRSLGRLRLGWIAHQRFRRPGVDYSATDARGVLGARAHADGPDRPPRHALRLAADVGLPGGPRVRRPGHVRRRLVPADRARLAAARLLHSAARARLARLAAGLDRARGASPARSTRRTGSRRPSPRPRGRSTTSSAPPICTRASTPTSRDGSSARTASGSASRATSACTTPFMRRPRIPAGSPRAGSGRAAMTLHEPGEQRAADAKFMVAGRRRRLRQPR